MRLPGFQASSRPATSIRMAGSAEAQLGPIFLGFRMLSMPVHIKSILERLLCDPDCIDDDSSVLVSDLHRVLISAHSRFPITFADLELMDGDNAGQVKARASFLNFVRSANEKFAMYLIKSENTKTENTALKRTMFSLTLHPVALFPHLLTSAGWLSEDKTHDVYLSEIDTALKSSDEFNCLALARSTERLAQVKSLANGVGLYVYDLPAR